MATINSDLVKDYDNDLFCQFLRKKFDTFAESREAVKSSNQLGYPDAQRLGMVRTLAGSGGLNKPLPVVAAKMPNGVTLSERSSRIKQFNFARKFIEEELAHPSREVDGIITQGLFVFYDDEGNFRLSLVFGKAEGTKLVWSSAKRLSFYVEADAANKTFRDRTALDWSTFDKLKEAFSVEKLTKEFYNRLFAWYQMAMETDDLIWPNDLVKDKEPGEVKSEQIIRLITRLMFVWFLKQKGLVPDTLFRPESLESVLQTFDPLRGENYYRAILQNLFFATLNTAIDERAFAVDAGTKKVNVEHFDVKILYRYGSEFRLSQDAVLELFRGIPFLNGGLFECLDRRNLYFDGFSREKGKQARVPNRLFFDEATGLIPLLSQYHFTVEENSPGDEEVALDPELLGKVFENLLGAYNPETKVAARNATGSFYTPREIVNYMVNESLKAHVLGRVARANGGEGEVDKATEAAIEQLFDSGERPEDTALCQAVDEALVTAKILDPACGSGAFPMGILLRMVELLRTLRQIDDDDHDAIYALKLELIQNCIYGGDIQCIAVQISKLRFFISLVCEQQPSSDPTNNYGIHTLPNLETKFVAADSLIGLPAGGKDVLELCTGDIMALKNELFEVRKQHFAARSYKRKKELRKQDERLRGKIKQTVRQDIKPDKDRLELLRKEREKVAEPKWESVAPSAENMEIFAEFTANTSKQETLKVDVHEKIRKALDADIEKERKKTSIPLTEIDTIADMLAAWDPYDQNTSAPFSDPEWMFNVRDGFDVVIGNPPYGRILSKDHEKVLSETWSSFRITKDAYVAFMLYSFQVTRKFGSVCLIVPSAWLGGPSYDLLREDILKHTVLQIISLPFDMFAAAYVDTAVTLFLNAVQPNGHKALAFAYPKNARINEFQPRPWQVIDQDEWRQTIGQKIILSSSGLSLQKKLQKTCSRSLRDVIEMKRGVLLDKKIPQKSHNKKHSIQYFEGDVYRYELHQKFSSWFTFGEGMKECPKSDHWFRGKRLLLRRLVNRKQRLMACLAEEDFLSNKNLYSLVLKMHEKTTIECILAIINSSLLSRLYINAVSQASKDDFPQVTITDFLSLPLPTIIPQSIGDKLTTLVTRILDTKKADPTADTTALEAEIDQLVYQLYGLTPEEITIVEGATEKPKGVNAEGVSRKAEGTAQTPKKRAGRRKKAALPEALPGWD